MKVGKVNVQENFDLANQYGIMTIPRVYVFRGGDQPVHQLVGLKSEAELVKLLEGVLRQ